MLRASSPPKGSALHRRLGSVAAALVVILLLARPARADELRADAGLVLALPAALETGLETGVGGGITLGRTFTVGARLSWSRATEHGMLWQVTHSDTRMRISAGVQHVTGRGVLALRASLGATVVHESRESGQAARAGLSGGEVEQSATRLLPGADVEGVLSLRVAGPVGAVVSVGPSLHGFEGVQLGWVAMLGLAWLP